MPHRGPGELGHLSAHSHLSGAESCLAFNPSLSGLLCNRPGWVSGPQRNTQGREIRNTGSRGGGSRSGAQRWPRAPAAPFALPLTPELHPETHHASLWGGFVKSTHPAPLAHPGRRSHHSPETPPPGVSGLALPPSPQLVVAPELWTPSLHPLSPGDLIQSLGISSGRVSAWF